MVIISEALERTVEELAKLPGMGRKSAQRIAMHLIRDKNNAVIQLAETLINLKTNSTICDSCFVVTDQNPCPICSNPKRNRQQICVVEDIKDVYAIERMNEFKGLYHVLGGLISPLDQIGPDQIRVKELITRVGQNNVSEIILALSASAEGEATSFYIQKLVQPFEIQLTRIAQGIPLGSDLEFVDEATLSRAFENRRKAF